MANSSHHFSGSKAIVLKENDRVFINASKASYFKKKNLSGSRL